MTNTSSPSIAILGGGILGLTCAYLLTRKFGQDSAHIFDPKGFPATNASFIAGGMLASYSELDHMPARFLLASLESLEFWDAFSAETGADIEFSRRGSLLLAHEADHHLLSRFEAILPPEPEWQKIDRIAILALEPSLARTSFSSALHIKDEGHLHPQKLMHALCNTLKNKHTAARTHESLKNQYDWVIDCRGMGAAADQTELRGVKGEILIVHNPDFTLSRPLRLMHPRYPLYIVPRDGGLFMIGATIIESDDNTDVSLRSGLELMSALFSLHPSFADAKIMKMNAGIRPAYTDNLPHIHVRDNVIICNGLYRHGYLLSPALAHSVVAHVLNEDCKFKALFLKDKNDGYYLERKAALA